MVVVTDYASLIPFRSNSFKPKEGEVHECRTPSEEIYIHHWYILSVVLPDYQLVIILNTVPLMSLIGISLTDFYSKHTSMLFHLAANHTFLRPPCLFQRLYYVMIGLFANSLAHLQPILQKTCRGIFFKGRQCCSLNVCVLPKFVKMLTSK